jgi:hypothetical protein
MIGLAALSSAAQASLLEFNTAGNLGTETTEPSTFNDPSVTASTLTFGAGVTAASNGNRFGGSNWFDTGDTNPTTLAESVAGNDYIQFTITPTAGSTYDVTNLQFIWDRSSTGPSGVTLRSSIDGYASDLATATGLVSTTTAYTTLNISGLTALSTATTFRLYGYGASAATGTGGFDTNSGTQTQANVGVNSNFANLPEPASLAVLGLGGLAVLRRRSR